MQNLFTTSLLLAKIAPAREWLNSHVFVMGNLVQLLLLLAAWLFSLLVGRRGRRLLARMEGQGGWLAGRLTLRRIIADLCQPFCAFLVLLFMMVAAKQAGWSHHLFLLTCNLLFAWIVIRLASALFPEASWVRVVGVTVFVLAALNILGLLVPVVELSDRLGITLGTLRISVLSLVKGAAALVVLLWAAQALLQLFEKRIRQVSALSPSLQVLFVKLLKIVLLAMAIIGSLSIIGVDLSSFTVFTGAIGVGIGFGLQKIVSNLISGIILLLDKSIKPGDVIVIGDSYGSVNSLGARYTSVVTRDGKEFLIPNEDLITQKVENWSFSSSKVRMKVPVGIHYRSDVRLAMALCLEAAQENGRILTDPSPVCLLIAFGDSSVDLQLRFWINDPQNGITNVKSAVLLAIWDKFHAHAIEIPYPQRDIHLHATQADTVSLAVGSATTPAPGLAPEPGS